MILLFLSITSNSVLGMKLCTACGVGFSDIGTLDEAGRFTFDNTLPYQFDTCTGKTVCNYFGEFTIGIGILNNTQEAQHLKVSSTLVVHKNEGRKLNLG